MPRRYPVEFRRKVLDLIDAGRPVVEIAEQLGITAQTVYNWRKQDRVDRGLEPGTSTRESAELTAARKRIRELETELAVTKRANELLKAHSDPKEVGGRRSDSQRGPPRRGDLPGGWRVGVGVLHVAASQAFAPVGPSRHGRRGHPPGHGESRQTYGARRVHAELVLGRKMVVARCTVELVMRRLGLAGLPGRPRYRKIPNTPTAEDLVNRKFARSEPNRLWLTDITEHRTREGQDLLRRRARRVLRRVVGWSIDSIPDRQPGRERFRDGIENREAEGVVIHSDHGTQFTSWAFTRRALDSGLVPSMGSIGDCYDNGQMESFWARMQVELLNRKRWNTRLELANAIFEYLEIFHNRQRRHSSLGMLSPIEYELRHTNNQTRDQAS